MDRGFIDDEDDVDIETSIEYINQIIEKIKSGDDADIENCGLRPIRELLQNADDAQATFMVFRFDKDRLWVYNNGASMKMDYLQALSTLGGASKKEVADTSGSFGTGFRATHMFTDTPEIEWVSYIQSKGLRDNAKHMTLKLEKWKDIEDRKNLPKTAYMKLSDNPDPDKLGVFFSFPWRTQNTTGLDDFGEYLWPASRICELATELRERIGPMLFGCRYLKNIRIVLTCGDDSTENFVFDASNSFSINDIKESGDDKGKLALSSGVLTNAQKMYDLNSTGAWNRSDHSWYLRPSLDQIEEMSVLDYYWAQRPVFSSKVALLDDAGNIELLSKRYWNMCILLFPLSKNAPCLPKYTPIPLGGLTDEKIGIVTFCPPAENRREIDTASPKTKKVIDHITLSAIALYGEHIEAVLDKISSLETMTYEEREAAIIALLPQSPPTKWLVESPKIEEGTFDEDNSSLLLWEALDRAVQRLKLACVDGQMLRLSETVHTIPESGGVLDERIGKILSSTNQAVLGQIWSQYYRAVSAAPGNTFRELVWQIFLWYERPNFHGSRAVHFIDNFLEIVNNNIGSLEENDLALSKLHNSMIELAISPPANWQGERLQDLHLIRDGDGHLLTVTEAIENNRVVIIPPKFTMYESYLHTIIGKSLTLAQKMKSETIKALNAIEKHDSLRLDSKKIIQLIDQSTQLHPLKHQNLGKHTDFHEAVSQLTLAAVKGGLSRSDIRGLRFLPVSRNGIIQTQEENTLKNGQLIWGVDSEVSFNTKSQGYHRDFVFPKLENDKYSVMPNYLKERLRFLALSPSISKDDVNQIMSHFIFNQAVNSKGEPLNLIRTLLTRGGQNNSNQHLVTESVFHPSTQFFWQPQHVAFGSSKLEVPAMDDKELFKQKLELLIWLLEPYENIPSTIGHSKISDVPYLPTHEGKWITPGEASTCTDKELLELIGRSSSGLHPDLVASLHTNVLKGLGVSGAISIEQAQDILHDVQAGRNTNRGLVINLLRHFFEFFDCKNESNKDLYAEFSNQPGPWVPVGSEDSASLRAANEAYWPNEEYDSFLGMHILDPQTIPEEISDSRVKELQKFFGFATKLRTEDALQLLDANRPSQLADEVDFEALQKYIAKNGFTTQSVSSDLPEAMIIMDGDGQEHRVPKGAVLATVAKKRAYGKMLTSAEAIPVFAHNEFSGGKKFCERLIEIGFCKEEPGVTDLIRELGNSDIAAGPCSEIWKHIGKLDDNTIDEAVLSESEEIQDVVQLMYASKNSVYSQTNIALNNGEENPLLDGGDIQLVLDARKLQPSVVSLLVWFEVEDFREISSEDVLAKATESGPYDIPVEDFDRVKRLVLRSENQLFGILQGVDRTFRLVNVNSLDDYIMLDQHKDLRYSILNTEKWLIHPLDDAEHAGRLAEHAVLFSQTNPEINPLLENLTSTPNTAMGEAISTYLLGEDSKLEWDESQKRRFLTESLNVEMVHGDIPRILIYRIGGQQKRVKLGGQAYCEKISEDGIDLYLSQNRQQCGPAEVASLVEECLLATSVQPPLRFKGQLASYLANPQDGRDLFESNQARETAQALVKAYSGCQVGSCRRITPYAENTTMTSEKRKAFIGKKDTFYKWNQSVNPNYPLGQNIWLCPRHHTLWERGLIKFEGLEKNTVDECREVLDELTDLSRTFDGVQIGIKIYDGKGREFNSEWEDDVLEVEVINGSNHGKEIYASLLDWVKKRLDQ